MSSPPSYDNVQSTPSKNLSIEQPPMPHALQPATAPHMPFTPAENASYVAQPNQPQQAVGYAYPNSQPFPPQQPVPSIIYVNAGNQQPPVVHQQFLESYVGHQIFACFVLWCCNWIFGLIAWILAMVAESTKHQNRIEARRLGKASLGLSISGIIVTVIIIAVILGIAFGGSTNCSSYKVNGICYQSRRYCYSSYYSCCFTKETYFSGYCYY